MKSSEKIIMAMAVFVVLPSGCQDGVFLSEALRKGKFLKNSVKKCVKEH